MGLAWIDLGRLVVGHKSAKDLNVTVQYSHYPTAQYSTSTVPYPRPSGNRAFRGVFCVQRCQLAEAAAQSGRCSVRAQCGSCAVHAVNAQQTISDPHGLAILL